jgi:N-acetylneuraminic acid mutarotase
MIFDFRYILEGGPRVSHTSLVSDTSIYYLFGENGKHQQRQYLDNALRYNMDEQTLSIVYLKNGNQLIQPRASHTSTMFNKNQFLCFGGNRGIELLNDCLVGSIDNESSVIQVKKLSSTVSTPCHRRGHSVVSVGNDKLFLFGGNGQDYCRNDGYIFDVSMLFFKSSIIF